jgi:MinD-like ATPase involved in chromosome partitioning or flagellar assembly
MASPTRIAGGATARAASGAVRVLVGLEATRDRALLHALQTAATTSGDPFQVVGRCLVAADLVAAAEAGEADAALVGEGLYGLEPATLPTLVDAGLRVVLLGSVGAPEGPLPAGVLALPAEAAPSQVCAVVAAAVRGEPDELLAALHAAGAGSAAARQDASGLAEVPAPVREGEVFVLIGPPRGNVGVTRSTIELGRELAETGSTLVIDAVLDEPAFAAALGLQPERNLAVVAAAPTRVDRERALGEMVQPLDMADPSRAVVLAGAPGAAQRARISPDFLSELIEQVSGPVGYRHTLIDAGAEPPAGTPAGVCWRALVEQADRVLLVVQPDLVGIRRALATLARLDAPVAAGRVAVILNRYQAGVHDDPSEVARLLDGVPVVGVVPHDERGCARALQAQRPLCAIGRSGAADELRRIADGLRRHPARPRARWWSRLAGRLGSLRVRRI